MFTVTKFVWRRSCLVDSLIQRTWMRQLSLLKLFYSGFAAPSLEIRSLDMLHFYIAVEELAEERADARSLLYGATSDLLIKLWRRTCCLTIMQRLLKPSCLDLIAKMFQRLFQGVIIWQSRCLMLCFLSSITAHNFLEEAPEFPIYSIAWRILFIFLFFFFKFSLVFSFIQRPFLLSNSVLANTCTSCCSDPMAVQSFKLQRVSKPVLKAVSSLDLFDKGKSGAGTLSDFCYGHAVWFLMVTMLAKKVAAASYSTTLINCFKCSFFVTANCHFDWSLNIIGTVPRNGSFIKLFIDMFQPRITHQLSRSVHNSSLRRWSCWCLGPDECYMYISCVSTSQDGQGFLWMFIARSFYLLPEKFFSRVCRSHSYFRSCWESHYDVDAQVT